MDDSNSDRGHRTLDAVATLQQSLQKLQIKENIYSKRDGKDQSTSQSVDGSYRRRVALATMNYHTEKDWLDSSDDDDVDSRVDFRPIRTQSSFLFPLHLKPNKSQSISAKCLPNKDGPACAASYPKPSSAPVRNEPVIIDLCDSP